MTIHSYIRWWCDYCDVTSPSLQNDEKPRGQWMELEHEGPSGEQQTKHFCCHMHLDKWQKENER